MRFTVAKDGDFRWRRGFLWLPLRVGEEWRWLERAVWREQNDDGVWRAIEWGNP